MIYVILCMILYFTLYNVISTRCIQKISVFKKIGKSPEIRDFAVVKKFFGLFDKNVIKCFVYGLANSFSGVVGDFGAGYYFGCNFQDCTSG